jgi:hypothetical protein
MIRVIYGDVQFGEASIRGHEKTPTLHGPDYLYTRHQLHLRVLLNVAINPRTSFTGFDKEFLDGFFKPRQELNVFVDNQKWLNVPAPDMDWGPKVLYTTVHQVVGPRTAWVDVGLEFAIRKQNEQTADESVIISTRWQAESEDDNLFWNSVTYSGEAVLRSDALAEQKKTAWDLRAAYILPPNISSSNCKRENLKIAVSEDGLMVRWSFTDKQVPYIALPAYVADASISVEGSSSQTTTDQLAWGIVDAATQAITLKAFGVGAITSAASMTTQIGKLAFNYVPSVSLIVKAVVFGRPDAKGEKLMPLARVLALKRLTLIPGFRAKAATIEIMEAGNAFDSRNRIATYQVVLRRQAITSSILRDATNINKLGIPANFAEDPAPAVEAIFDSDGAVQSLEYYSAVLANSTVEPVNGILGQTFLPKTAVKPTSGIEGAASKSSIGAAALADSIADQLSTPFGGEDRKVIFL